MTRIARVLGVSLLIPMAAVIASYGQNIWVSAYYVGWKQSHLPPEEIDFNAITHLFHFAVWPNPDGTLDSNINVLTPANVSAAVGAAHDAGKKILFTIGGQGSRSHFKDAVNNNHRKAFVENLVRFMVDNKYDGIDIDWEEILPKDAADYTTFIRDLRARLDQITPRPLLTAAVLWEPSLFAQLADKFDQINIMTYNLSGPYPGWVTWHNGSLYDGGYRFPRSSLRLPSIDGFVQSFLTAGVPRSKLGIGVCFNGYAWTGGEVNKPLEAWKMPPSVKEMPYYELADNYKLKEYDYTNSIYQWDDKAQAAYLSVSGPHIEDKQFISYDNEVSVRKKVHYARENHIGGIFIWELGSGYRDSQPSGRRDVLLQAVKQSAFRWSERMMFRSKTKVAKGIFQ